MTENQRLRIFVSGRVQGVGFRYFTLAAAQSLQLTGWVRNLPDGRVEALAEGPKDHLLSLLEKLWQGPSAGYVSDVKTQWLPASGEFPGFTVRHY